MGTETKPPQVQDREPGVQTKMHPEPEVMPRFPGSNRLAGKTAIVTGGDSGIGQAVAILFAREGANVAVLYLDETEDARRTAKLVQRRRGRQPDHRRRRRRRAVLPQGGPAGG